MNLKSSVHYSNHLFVALNNQSTKVADNPFVDVLFVITLFCKLKYWIVILLLLGLGYFDLFVDSIHNVAPQEEMADLWHIKESKTNVGIWSSIRYATLKDYDEF
jgi:hypothetical protein